MFMKCTVVVDSSLKDDEIVTLFHRVTTDGGIDPDAPVVTPDANDLGEFNFNYIKLPVAFADETYAKKLDVMKYIN